MDGFVNKVNNNMQWQMSSFNKEANIVMKIMDMNKDSERKHSTIDSGHRRESAAREPDKHTKSYHSPSGKREKDRGTICKASVSYKLKVGEGQRCIT